MPGAARAYNTFSVSTLGIPVSGIGAVIDGVITVAEVSIVPVSIAVFVAGALVWVLSPGKEDLRTKGKDLMIGALVGVGVVYGARGILNTVLYFIYG